jgi:lipoate-protein ligase A
MKYLDSTFTDPARNLACDEALLDFCEANDAGEVLRVWEPANYFIVVGYSNKVSSEANVGACAARGIPILRRFSGGGAVLQGPGCLNYALVIKNERAGSVGDISESYKRVLTRHQVLFERILKESARIEGTSDLAISGQKFSGNAQHRKRSYAVFHGTFLLNFDLTLIEVCLSMPSKQPDYRGRRSHQAFLRNLLIDCDLVRQSLREEWQASDEFRATPYQKVEELVETRYGRNDWNFKF